MKHHWNKGKAQDGHGNQYNCYFCDKCDYLVVAFPQLPEESRHMPGSRLILIRQKDLTITDVERFTKKYNVTECPSDDDGDQEEMNVTMAERFKRIVASLVGKK